jgi:hypothetical protein
VTKTINKYDLEALQDFMYNCGVRADYSGRGMYGAECIGFVTDKPLRIGYAIAAVFGVDDGTIDCEVDEDRCQVGEKLMDAATTDSMGYDTIVYFPGFTVEGADAETRDEERAG